MPTETAAARAADWFRDSYGGTPDGVWHAPGRVNLIGEHTDYNDGFVLPFALAQGVRVAGARRDDGRLELRSRQAPGEPATARISELAPGSTKGWAAYAAGVAWALREAGLPVGGATLAVDSDLPAGAGLSSSAALECAVAAALTGLHGTGPDGAGLDGAGLDGVGRLEVAQLAQRAEEQYAGMPCGIMDQCASLLGTVGHALLLDCRSLAHEQVPLALAEADLELLVIETRAQHEHVGGGYTARRRSCEEAARRLGVASLREVADVAALADLDGELYRRARHVITENERVRAVTGMLRLGDIAGTGPVLTASHRSLRDDFEVSWLEADAAVAAVLAAGALGARMTGGGFGGSVIALTAAAGHDRVVGELEAAYKAHGWPAPHVTAVTAEAGAHQIA